MQTLDTQREGQLNCTSWLPCGPIVGDQPVCKECTNMELNPSVPPIWHLLQASRGLGDGVETKIGHEGATWTTMTRE